MKDFAVVIPARDEEAGLPGVIDALKAALPADKFDYEIIVVDDGSRDNTGAAARDKGVRLVTNEQGRGYGAALKRGIRLAEAEWIVITDADGTYPAPAVPELLAQRGEADMVVGARTGPNARIPLVRRPAKWLLTSFARFLSGVKIPDLNSGLRVFRREDALRLRPLLPNGFSFTSTITLALLAEGREVRYREIDYHRRAGRSKIRPIRDTISFFALVLRTATAFNPLKVFLPISLLLLTAGLTAGVIRAILVRNVGTVEAITILTALHIGMLGLLADVIRRRTRL